MTWLDLVIAALFVSVVGLEIKRGFGSALFDALAVIISMRAAYLLVNPDTGIFKISGGASTGAGLAYLLAFMVIGVVMLIIGNLIYKNLLFSADAFDGFLGGVLGLVVGVTICHVLVAGLTLMAGTGDIANTLKGSTLTPELLNFTTYHRLMDFLHNFN